MQQKIQINIYCYVSLFPQMSSGFEVCGETFIQVIPCCSAFGFQIRQLGNKSSRCLCIVQYFITHTRHITALTGMQTEEKTNVAA